MFDLNFSNQKTKRNRIKRSYPSGYKSRKSAKPLKINQYKNEDNYKRTIETGPKAGTKGSRITPHRLFAYGRRGLGSKRLLYLV